jgi:hypothetical protein
MSVIGSNILAGVSGSAAGEALYVEDVFSTYVYEGNNTTHSINNGIDLAGKGGLTWIKIRRSTTDHNLLYDTERGATKQLISNENIAETTESRFSSFNSNGFTITTNDNEINNSAYDYASWSFRKAPGFFDVVTYTGNGTAGRTVAHNLGSVPGMIIIKKLNSTGNFFVYHRSLGATSSLRFNLTAAENISSTYFNDTEPTSTEFTVGTASAVNASGSSFVAYIFAHDDQSFGTDSDESIVKCGSYVGNGSATGPVINLGFEPQWLLIKRTSGGTGNWLVYDAMRGIPTGGSGAAPQGNPQVLYANTNDVEQDASWLKLDLLPTGFQVKTTNSDSNANGADYAYMAIRRSHKPPTVGTEVFTPQATRGATDGTPGSLAFTAGFPVDLLIYTHRNYATGAHSVLDRMRGAKWLETASNVSESNSDHKLDSNDGVYMTASASATSVYGGLMFKRAPGFFDVVAYTGTGSVKTENHNLTAVPEMLIIKKRDSTGQWVTYHSSQGNTKYHPGFRTDPFYASSSRWNNTSPTSTQFTVGTDSDVNGSTQIYIAYLFATLPGISKVGSYTGTGSSGLDVDCGFTSGARFVLIKRADTEIQGSAPDRTNWYLWDSARGIVSGNDPWIALNMTSAEVTNTDYIDPLNAGFTVSTTGAGLNASGGTYLFLAIA